MAKEHDFVVPGPLGYQCGHNSGRLRVFPKGCDCIRTKGHSGWHGCCFDHIWDDNPDGDGYQLGSYNIEQHRHLLDGAEDGGVDTMTEEDYTF